MKGRISVTWYDYFLIIPLLIKASRAIELARISLDVAKKVRREKTVLVNVKKIYNQNDPDFLRDASKYADDPILCSILVEMREKAILDLKGNREEPNRTALFERVNFIDDLFAAFAEIESKYDALLAGDEEKE